MLSEIFNSPGEGAQVAGYRFQGARCKGAGVASAAVGTEGQAAAEAVSKNK